MPFYDGVLTLLWIREALEKERVEDDELSASLDPTDFGSSRKRWER
jgi:hypothetical protein